MTLRTIALPFGAPNTVDVVLNAEFTRIAGAVWLVDIWYWTTFCPARKTVLPAVDIAVNTAFVPLPARNWSAISPPQPRLAPSAAPACQVDCWSLWLCRLAGSGTERALYCALV